jgi:hypothetical protein
MTWAFGAAADNEDVNESVGRSLGVVLKALTSFGGAILMPVTEPVAVVFLATIWGVVILTLGRASEEGGAYEFADELGEDVFATNLKVVVDLGGFFLSDGAVVLERLGIRGTGFKDVDTTGWGSESIGIAGDRDVLGLSGKTHLTFAFQPAKSSVDFGGAAVATLA